ncbi:hypothetical protein KC319_g15 [Hortaea werneckii]|nr:hypothetical protein KC319_g15 [Hortaea werneckii]
MPEAGEEPCASYLSSFAPRSWLAVFGVVVDGIDWRGVGMTLLRVCDPSAPKDTVDGTIQYSSIHRFLRLVVQRFRFVMPITPVIFVIPNAFGNHQEVKRLPEPAQKVSALSRGYEPFRLVFDASASHLKRCCVSSDQNSESRISAWVLTPHEVVSLLMSSLRSLRERDFQTIFVP